MTASASTGVPLRIPVALTSSGGTGFTPQPTFGQALPSTAALTPHFAWPPRLAKDGSIGVVDQDTPDEIAQAAALVLSTPVGSLIDNPAFGTPDQTFKSEIDTEQVHDALRQWEPRLAATITAATVKDLIAQADVTVQETANG